MNESFAILGKHRPDVVAMVMAALDTGGVPAPACDIAIDFAPEAGIVLRPRAAPRPAAQPDDPLAALVGRIRLRDAAAMRALHDACGARLYRAAMRVVHRPEVAHEVVSATFVQVWNRAADFDASRAGVLGWLHTIVRSRALDLLRRELTHSRHEALASDADLDALVDVAPTPCQRIERTEASRRLRRAMTLLTPAQRQVLSLTFLDGLSQDEAAAHMGVPLGTLKSHARRGLAALRTHAGLREACL